VTVVLRKAYGAGYFVMNGTAYEADYIVAWPTAEIAVMGPQAAVNIIFKRQIAAAPDPEAKARALVADYVERFANPYAAAERGYVDDVVEPHQTRARLIRALHLLEGKRVERPARRHGNIPL
jgi:propionyl-CoA carboxylase beta chain